MVVRRNESPETTSGSSPIRVVILVFALLLLASGCAALEGETSTDAGGDINSEQAGADSSGGGQGSDEGSDDETETTDPEGATVEETSTTETTIAPDIQIPDLVGQTQANARTALAGLGIDEPVLETRESFEPAGTVLDQVPGPGSLVTGPVTLIVAESIAPMPDFVGQKIADVRAWVAPREIEIRTETFLTDDIPAGEVTDQIPVAGAQVSQEVVITVAEAPTIVDLVDLGALEDRYSDVKEIQMNGELFGPTHRLSTRNGADPWITFNLSRDWSTLKMDLGLSDELSASAVIQVEIKGDGEVLYSDTVAFGSLTPIELDVTDVLRLSVVATQVGGSGYSYLGLGNAQLLGGSSAGG